MAIEFEDDGASFRVRRMAQLAQMMQPARMVVIDHGPRLQKQPVPLMLKLVMWPIGIAFVAFLAVLAFCIGDFILWSLGLPV